MLDINLSFDIKGIRIFGKNMENMSVVLYMLLWLLNIVFLRFGLEKLIFSLFFWFN